MKKRIFALALALCMMLSVMPTSFAGNGFLTLDNGEQAPSAPSGILTPGDPVLPEEDLSGEPQLTPDGPQLTPDDSDDEPRLTLDDPVDEPEDRPARQWHPAPFEEETSIQCDICGYLDGSHAVDCPVINPPEEPAPAQSTIAEYKPAPMSAATYQDIYDSMMSAETLAEYKAELSALSADMQEEFFSLLTGEEREALSAWEDSLAHDALTVTGAENATRTVTVEARASAFSFALHEALRQLGQDLIVSIYGRILESIDLPQNDYTMLETITPTDGAQYQWQIQADDDLWVDIYNETGSIIRVSYAMVASLLDRYDTVQVRCEITGEDGVSFTDPVEVCVDNASEDVYIDAEEEPIEPVILDEGKVEITQGQPVEPEAPAGPEEITEPEDTAEPATPAEPEDTSAPEDTAEPENTADPVAQSFSVTRLGGVYAQNFSVRQLTGEEEQATGDTPSTYNVVINYVFENNAIAADPYTANLAAGSPFSATVTFPTVQGYLPYVNDVQQDSIQLSYPAIDQDYTINVVYKPTNVDYTVIHYQQNLTDDNYQPVKTETLQGLTNSIVPEAAKTYEGFYALLYEKPAIAADGSTLVEVYYDRYYYLMNFDLDGGYGVEPIYARYGTPIGDVGTPTKAGYTFQGWSLNGTDIVTLPETMPSKNTLYKAVWEADDTAKVTVVFWGENADNEEYSYIKSSTVNVKPGTEFTYNESGALICALEEHTHSLDECYELTCTQEKHTHSEACYTCGQTEHTTHTKDCYDGVGNQQNVYTGVPNNPVNGQVVDHWGYGNLIYINGSWYRYSGDTAAGRIAPTTCHKHFADCIGCGKTEHTHSIDNGCYTLTCGKTEHTHKSDCYMSGAGLDSNLWTFVRSDTVTVAADGSSVVNVYYDRVEYSVQFYNQRGNSEYKDLKITAKWGASILDKWPTYSGSSSWYVSTSKNSAWQNSIQLMPVGGAKFYGPKTGSKSYTALYYVEVLPGESGTLHNGITYKLHHQDTSVSSGNVSNEDRYEIPGFTFKEGTENGSSYNNATFYYTRNSYTLTFNDGYNDVKKESVKYEASLDNYSSYVPAVPSAYEPGSVEFDGWYLNPECSGQKFDFSSHTMPAGPTNTNGEVALSLYAKWVPVSHTVEFYLDHAALNAGTKLSTHPDVTVRHGSKLNPTPAEPENGSYTFVGWFYMENGVEKAFDFANMPVKKDMQVYGKWSSNVLKQYTVYYKGKDADGNEIEIAAPTTGSGLAGATKTFDAKGGTDLYAAYQEGYFPVTKSHSMILDINATEENNTNVYTFWYVQKEAVPYTVKYLNKDTGKPVATEKTVSDNRKAVVTETFVTVSGMMPDAYQKRLVVSAEEDAVNEIIFYYTEDTTHAYYKITHYTENLGTDASGKPTWTEYASSQAVGDIGTTYNADPMTIPGFTHDSKVEGTVISGELTANGLELKLYYTRNSYPYQVRYLEQGTGKQLAAPKDGTGKYGEVVSEEATDITNYTAVDPTSQTLNIKIEESQTEVKLNIITFYYKLALTDLTISKTWTGAECYGQDAIFTVTGNGLNLKVVIPYGTGSVTITGLTVGQTYTVTEDSGWSWRYTAGPTNCEITLKADKAQNKIAFTNTLNKIYWLDDSDHKKNKFGVPNGN